MEQKKEITGSYVSKGLRVIDAVRIAGISKSTYYYQPNGRPKGKRPSRYTFKQDGTMVSNKDVVNEIIELITPEYHDYGYQVVTELLKRKGYVINHKKVYRLMKDFQLLHPKIIRRNPIEKVFIKYTVPPLLYPFATVETDLKYVFVHGENRNAFLITFLCTFSRFAPVWDLQYSMTSAQVIKLVEEFLTHPEVNNRVRNVVIRTDNGPQFIAKKLAKALNKAGIQHEFINPGTPQQNGHIESFHSTVTRLVCNRNIFENLNHARKEFGEFFFAYNYTRVMKSLLHYPPVAFLKLWETGTVGIKKDKRNREIFFFREKPTPQLEDGSSSEDLLCKNKNNIFDYSVFNQLEISPVL